MKKIMLSYVQPVMVAAILMFWAMEPAAWLNSGPSLVLATLLTTALVEAAA